MVFPTQTLVTSQAPTSVLARRLTHGWEARLSLTHQPTLAVLGRIPDPLPAAEGGLRLPAR